jgi:hypothetical protein
MSVIETILFLSALLHVNVERSYKHPVSYNEDTEEEDETSSSIDERVGRGGRK